MPPPSRLRLGSPQLHACCAYASGSTSIMEKLPSCPPTRLGTQGICTTTEKVGRKRLPSSPAHRSPLSPRALSYEETASSTASLTAADCARMDNFISTVLLDLPFSRHQVTRARTRMYTDTHTHTHTHTYTHCILGPSVPCRTFCWHPLKSLQPTLTTLSSPRFRSRCGVRSIPEVSTDQRSLLAEENAREQESVLPRGTRDCR